MFKVVIVVLAVAAIGIWGQILPPLKSCKDMPRLPVPDNHILVSESPFLYYVSTPMFYCSTKVFTNPEKGQNDYRGTALSIRGGNVIAFDYNVLGQNTINATVCSLGISQMWYVARYNTSKDGTDFTLYTCNGDDIQEFAFGANYRKCGKAIKSTLDFVKQYNGGDKVGRSRDNCSPTNGCKVF